MLQPRTRAAAVVCALVCALATPAHAHPEREAWAKVKRNKTLSAKELAWATGRLNAALKARDGRRREVMRSESRSGWRRDGETPEVQRPELVASPRLVTGASSVGADSTERMREIIEELRQREAVRAMAMVEIQPDQPRSLLPDFVQEIITPARTIFGYIDTLFRPAASHVRLTCPDGRPIPDALRATLDRAAREFGCPILVTSGYRSPAHNKRVGGATRSQHMACRAVDFKVPCARKEDVFAWLKRQPHIKGAGIYRSHALHADTRPGAKLVTWDWRKKKRARYAYRKQHRG